MASIRQEVVLFCLLLVGVINGQLQQVPGGPDKQIRLEDIERDNLNSQAQKEQVGPPVSHNNYHPAAAAHQQQLASYQQQQFYLQQLQQQQHHAAQQSSQQQVPQHHPAAIQAAVQHQVIVPQPVPYNTLPVMIIQQQPLVDQLAQYYLQQQLAALQYQPVTHAVQAIPPQALAHPALIPQAIPQQVVQILPQQQLAQQQAQAVRTQPSKPFRPSPPLAPAQPRPQTQTLVYTQQHYNPYNTIYQQQQQQKFLSGVKSTPAPPLKESQGPVQASQYATFKSF